jgi:thiamine-monophosphate kinase
LRLSEIGGEFGFIERLRQTYAATASDGLVVSIGDDAAVLNPPPDRQIVVTTDMLVEQVHFRRDWSDAYSIGWKAAAANLSDIAAMGADPTFAFISIAFTAEETVENLDRLYDGFSDCLNRYGARLAGGDTNVSPENRVISVTLLGSVPAGEALTRTGARIGDALLVTGTLGSAALGLALLNEHGYPRAEKISQPMVAAHRRPQPRVVAGRAAAQTRKVRAAMDISDGLLGDVKKLTAASGVGARIDSACLPISDEMRAAAEILGVDPIDLALEGGEDYELLLSVAQADVDLVKPAIEETGIAVTVVGEVIKAGLRVIAPNGTDELETKSRGWDHFAQAEVSESGSE